MLGSPILDVLFGVVFVFLVLSLMTTAVNETVAGLLGRRSGFLRKWLRDQLDDKEAVTAFYNQPIVKSLGTRRWFGLLGPRPSYIKTDLFVTSLLDTVLADDVNIGAAQISAVSNPQIRKVLTSLAGSASETIENVRADAEKWFDAAMERVSGAFKRRTQIWLWVIALVTTVGLNVDTLLVVRTLWTDSSVRDVVVKQADQFLADNKQLTDKQDFEQSVNRVRDLKQLQIPMGWAKQNEACKHPTSRASVDPNRLESRCDPRTWPRSASGMLLRLVGWLATAAALTLGAPFWFDALSKVARLRSSGNPPKKESTG
jgi:hypothetical protein